MAVDGQKHSVNDSSATCRGSQSPVVDGIGVQDEALYTLISMRQRFTINSYQLAPNAV